MVIQILGSGCPNCKALEKNANEANVELGLEAEVVKITDPDEIMDMGVMMTPALALDGKVLSSGKLLSKKEIVNLIAPESDPDECSTDSGCGCSCC